MIGNRYADLQNRLFTIFQFVFVAREFATQRFSQDTLRKLQTDLLAGVIAQVQPKFIANRDIFEGENLPPDRPQPPDKDKDSD